MSYRFLVDRVFSQQPITCVEYKNITPGTERDIFQRVQMGVPLVAAEKLQAIDSPWARWISSLEQKHVHSDDGLSTLLDWDWQRGRAFQCLAHLVYLCDELPKHASPTAPKITKWISREDDPPDRFKEDIEQALTHFWMIARDDGHNKGFRKIPNRLAPIEFAFTGLLMYIMQDISIYSQRERADAIYDMRTYIRKHFPDVRNRSDIGQRLWHFISYIQNPNSVSLDDVLEGTAKRAKKRKAHPKPGSEDDDDGDFRPTVVSHAGPAKKTRSTKKR